MIGKLLRGRRRQESATSEPRTPRQESEEDAALAQDSLAASQQYDPALFSNIREQWVSRHMASRVADYTARNPINVVAACWNVAAKPPPDESIGDWLRCASRPDVVAVGLQEAVDLNATNIAAGAASAETGAAVSAWEARVTAELDEWHGRGAYTQLACRQLVGLALFVYVRREIVHHTSAARVAAAGTGLLGVMGNKGAVAVSLRVHSSTLCFVTCHLAHGGGAAEARNADYRTLCERLVFDGSELESHPVKPEASLLPETVESHEFVVWFGDLNYRIDLPSEVIRKAVASADYAPLLASDQLRNAQAWGAAFVGYEEAPITFAPTYKYDPGTDVYDTSEKRRPPAYCDRVLWRGPKKHAACTTYGRHELRAADHRPVSAALALSVAVPNEERRQEVHREIVRTLDAWENASIPTAALDTNDLQFGSVSFGEAVSRTLVLTNTGQTRLAFSFQPLPDAAGSLDKPPWLFVSPWSDMLLPGETCEIEATVYVGAHCSAALNGGFATLEAILLLRLEHGRDFYCTVSGVWQRSCMGVALSHQLSLGGPIGWSESSRAGSPQLTTGSTPVKDEAPRLPYEVSAMLSVLARPVAAAEAAAAGDGPRTSDEIAAATAAAAELADLFDAKLFEGHALVDAVPDEAAALHALNHGGEVEAMSARTAAALLLRWLHALAEPLVCASLYEAAASAATAMGESSTELRRAGTPLPADSIAEIVLQLPQPHHSVLEAILLLARRLLRAHAAASAAAAAEDGAAAALGQSQQTDDGADDADEPAAPTAFLAQRLAAVLGDAILQPARTAPKAPPGGKSTRRTSYAEPSAKSGKGTPGAYWKLLFVLALIGDLDADDAAMAWRSAARR